jgi:translation initiation factor 3 subunit A
MSRGIKDRVNQGPTSVHDANEICWIQRAQELIAVGQTQAALQILHEHVTSKRSRSSPIPSLEPVMLLFVELCVDLRKGKLAKDGLYQYKNVAQNTNVGTIEVRLRRSRRL